MFAVPHSNAAARRPHRGTAIRLRTIAIACVVGGVNAIVAAAHAQEFALATSEQAEESDSTLELSASRASGVAPLSIFFDTNGSAVSGVDDAFHQGLFEWNFGDDDAGTWATTGRSKNTAAGPLAHHVYEAPGVYLAIVKVRDAEGRIASKSVEITVTDPDEVFAGEQTVCLSTSGNFDGCPDGASQLRSGGATGEVAAQLGSSRRVLLRRGERWAGGGFSIPEGATTGILGAYGEGDAPLIQHGGGTGITVRGDDFRIMDLQMVATSVPSMAIGHGPGDDTLVMGVSMDGYKSGIGESAGGNENAPGFAAVDNVVGELRGGKGGYGAYLWGSRIALQGNVVEDERNVEHGFRSPALVQAVISHNDFGPPARTKTAMKIHAHAVTGGNVRYTERVLVSDNILRGYFSGWTAVFGPQNAQKDERVRDVIFERNHIISGGGGVGVVVTASRITVRNNVIDMSGEGAGVCVNVKRRGIEPAPDGVTIYNNTCYSRDGHEPRLALVEGTARNVAVTNNLIVSHDSGTPLAVSGGGDNVTQASNLETTDAVFVSDAPAARADFALREGAAAIDAGGTPPGASIDLVGRDAPADGNGDGTAEYDLGAAEFAAE